MILKEKKIPDATMLRLASRLLKADQRSTKYRVKTKNGDVAVSYGEVFNFLDTLAKRLDEGEYGVIHRCDTCGNFNPSGRPNKKGWCSPKEHSLFRGKREHCSKWVPMTEEQKRLKERLDEHFEKLQAK